MANPLLTIKLSGVKKASKGESYIRELIAKSFATRNLLHFAHWSTGSYAAHNAVGDLYDSIIEDVDDIVETYMGKHGKLTNLSTEKVDTPDDICAHVKREASWVETNRSKIAGGDSSIANLVDNLIASYHKTVYKLENLH